MRTQWTGACTALITPFTKTGDVDEPAVRRLVRRQIDAGIHFLSPCGTTGENPTLSDAERLRIVGIVVDEAAGKVTLKHGPIKNLGMEVGMTMTFRVKDPAMLREVQVGDKVEFEAEQAASGYTVTKMQKSN